MKYRVRKRKKLSYLFYFFFYMYILYTYTSLIINIFAVYFYKKNNFVSIHYTTSTNNIKGNSMQETAKQEAIQILVNALANAPLGLKTGELAEILGCDAKTIQNYHKELCHEDMSLNYIEDVRMIRIRRGVYFLQDYRVELEDVALERDKKVFLKLALENLENLTDLSKHHDEIEEELKLGNIKTPYFIKSEEYQQLNTDEEEIEKLEEAINQDHVIAFTFKRKDFYVEPYRLVNFDGIWYLYGKDRNETEENAYKTWMLKHISKVEVFYDETHDLPDEEIDEDLEKAESAMFVPDKTYTVKAKIHKEVADNFMAKRQLPEQQIEKQPDGSLIATATVSTKADIDAEIEAWLPYIEILEPQEYKESFKEELQNYLAILG